MISRKTLLALSTGVVAIGLLVAAAAVIGFGDSPLDGDVVKVEAHPDGSVDTYREQADGEVVIEHRNAAGEVWFESNEVLGPDGDRIICPDGEPLRIDFDAAQAAPSQRELARARRHVPRGKALVFNEYTGDFQTVNTMRVRQGNTTVQAQVGLVYKCGPNNEPLLVPLSDVDPEAAAAARRDMQRALAGGGDGLSGLGSDPAAADR